MAELGFIDDSMSIWTLFRARAARSKGNANEARIRLNKALTFGSGSSVYPLALAFDATLMAEEGGRVPEARSRLHECLNCIEGSEGRDVEFISAFCEAWLAISDEDKGYPDIESACLRSNETRRTASRFAKLILVHLPIDDLKEICGDRKSLSYRLRTASREKRVLNAKVTLDF